MPPAAVRLYRAEHRVSDLVHRRPVDAAGPQKRVIVPLNYRNLAIGVLGIAACAHYFSGRAKGLYCPSVNKVTVNNRRNAQGIRGVLGIVYTKKVDLNIPSLLPQVPVKLSLAVGPGASTPEGEFTTKVPPEKLADGMTL